MHRSRSLLALALASMLVMSVGLSGCAPSSGTVTVEVRPASTADSDWSLKVTVRDSAKKIVARHTMRAGESRAFAGIPLGAVTITAQGLCVLGTTLTESGVHAILEPLHCEI